jgi:hypothetical protein
MDESGGKTSTLSLISELRKLGVTKYKDANVEVELGALPEIEEPVNPVDKSPKIGEAPKLGKDGLTAAQQLETYGAVIDAKE